MVAPSWNAPESRQQLLLLLGAAAGCGFLLGSLFARRRSAPAPPAVPRATPAAHLARSGSGDSIASRATNGPQPGDKAQWKMVLLIRSDAHLGIGSAARLAAHGALRAYKKLILNKDPVRVAWEKEGSQKLCLEATSLEQLRQFRAQAKAQGMPTVEISGDGAEGCVLVIGPAAAADVDHIVGGLRLFN